MELQLSAEIGLQGLHLAAQPSCLSGQRGELPVEAIALVAQPAVRGLGGDPCLLGSVQLQLQLLELTAQPGDLGEVRPGSSTSSPSCTPALSMAAWRATSWSRKSHCSSSSSSE